MADIRHEDKDKLHAGGKKRGNRKRVDIMFRGERQTKKTYLISREGFIIVYPSLYKHKEKGIFGRIIRRLIQFRKEHKVQPHKD